MDNELNTKESFFTYAFTQAKTQEQRLAIYFIKEGYMLPNHLEKVTWEDIDLEIGGFKSKNYYDIFWATMSSKFQEELADYKSKKNNNGLVFQNMDTINNLINQLSVTLKDYPNVLEQVNQLYSKKPKETIRDIYFQTTQQSFTRDCLDPWQHLELREGGSFEPCCKIYNLESKDKKTVELLRKKLRKNLLDGKLINVCATCHIRTKTTTQKFERKINKLAKKHQIDRLEAFPLCSIRIELSSNCNLRCVYCQVSRPNYKGNDINEISFEKALKILQNAPRNVKVHLNGHGETTFHPKWEIYAQQIIDLGYKPEMITNLSKNYTEHEIKLLSEFNKIEISLDSNDEEMMLTIRKAVRPSKIFNNLELIRQLAKDQGIKPPFISFSVGVYDPSIWSMEAFMLKLATLKIDHVTFWNLVEYDHNQITKPLSSLPIKQFEKAYEMMHRSFRVLYRAGINYTIAGSFIEDIKEASYISTKGINLFRKIKNRL